MVKAFYKFTDQQKKKFTSITLEASGIAVSLSLGLYQLEVYFCSLKWFHYSLRDIFVDVSYKGNMIIIKSPKHGYLN